MSGRIRGLQGEGVGNQGVQAGTECCMRDGRLWAVLLPFARSVSSAPTKRLLCFPSHGHTPAFTLLLPLCRTSLSQSPSTQKESPESLDSDNNAIRPPPKKLNRKVPVGLLPPCPLREDINTASFVPCPQSPLTAVISTSDSYLLDSLSIGTWHLHLNAKSRTVKLNKHPFSSVAQNSACRTGVQSHKTHGAPPFLFLVYF